MKKVLILTVTAGEGHNSVAKAFKDKFSKMPDCEVKVIDLFKEYSTKFKVSIIDDGYRAAVKYLPSIYNICYSFLEKRPKYIENSPSQSIVSDETPKLFKSILAYKPDFILCTHFYPAIAITNLRRIYNLTTKVGLTMTDYGIPPFLEAATGVDFLFITNQLLEEELIKKGFKKEQLVFTGLPVKDEFTKVIDKSEARKKLNLNPNMFTVMLMVGGGGATGIKPLYKKLLKVEKPIQIIVINGKDKSSKKAIDEYLELVNENEMKHTVINLGFVSNIADFMSASDCIVGKCGGISCTESTNKELPLIIAANVLMAQEVDNYIFLKQNNAVLYADKEQKLNKIIDMCMRYPDIFKDIRNNLNRIKKPNALNDICNFMMNFSPANYSVLEEEYFKSNSQIKIKIRKAKSTAVKCVKENNSEIKKIKVIRNIITKEKENKIKKYVKAKKKVIKKKNQNKLKKPV